MVILIAVVVVVVVVVVVITMVIVMMIEIVIIVAVAVAAAAVVVIVGVVDGRDFQWVRPIPNSYMDPKIRRKEVSQAGKIDSDSDIIHE